MHDITDNMLLVYWTGERVWMTGLTGLIGFTGLTGLTGHVIM